MAETAKKYYRPLVQFGPVRPSDAHEIAGGWCWFNQVEVIERRGGREIVPASQMPADVLQKISAPRADIAGLSMTRPALMGILNVTPDSFSDGGKFTDGEIALRHALQMVADGADILDIGGESTRPGADVVAIEEEINRTQPIIAAIKKASQTPVSIDTRKSEVARAALSAGAMIVNDVSGFSFDPKLAEIVEKNNVPVCLMHALGDPKTMQEKPEYDDVLLDVFDYLEGRIAVAVAAGIRHERIVVDPGIGFGKTVDHNLSLMRGLSVFHALGCPILLGASRKRFIGTLANVPDAADRGTGSVAVTLAGIAQGVQIHRIHDVADTRQAVTLWQAATGTGQ